MNKRVIIKKVWLAVTLVCMSITCAPSIAETESPTPLSEDQDNQATDEIPNISATDSDDQNDPFEPINRFFFGFNRILDGLFVKPMAIMYRGAVPDPIRNGVTNALNNLLTPVIFVNSILQGNPSAANTTLFRFTINSTIGILGIMDPATKLGIPGYSKDFDQTLGIWGMRPGPYLMLPIFGPSSFRGVIGLAGDYYSDPFNYYAVNTHRRYLIYARYGIDIIDRRSKFIEVGEDLERNSPDLYAAIRSIYTQRRAFSVSGQDENADTPTPVDQEERQKEPLTGSPSPKPNG